MSHDGNAVTTSVRCNTTATPYDVTRRLRRYYVSTTSHDGYAVSTSVRCNTTATPLLRQYDVTIDIYTVDTVLPVHIVWYDEATAKSATQDGGLAETYICGRILRLMHLYRSVEASTSK